MTSKPRILIIDDDLDLVETISMILDSSGFETATAYDGHEGLARAREIRPDLIVLDIIMPELDGYGVCRELKGDPELAGVPVVMLTSEDDYVITTDISQAEGRVVMADDFFEKPVDPEALVERIYELLSI
jgi:two-component system alkaline phosphatase synthesis response regulator PhoP